MIYIIDIVSIFVYIYRYSNVYRSVYNCQFTYTDIIHVYLHVPWNPIDR